MSSTAPDRPLPGRLGEMSARRRRGLMRLAVLIVGLIVLVVVLVALLGGGDDGNPNKIVYRDAADTPGPLDILSAQMDQQGPQLVLTMRTNGIWTPGQLAAEPGRSVCTTLWAKDDSQPRSRVCVVSRAGNPSLVLRRFRDGAFTPPAPLVGQIRRRNLKLLEARFSFRDVRLPLGKFRWQVESTWVGEPGGCPPAATPAAQCSDTLPDRGSSPGKVTRPLLLGCTAPGPDFVLNGPRGRKVVALTFDDGPSEFTPQVLDILRRDRVRATFFVIGGSVAGREALLRRELEQGNVIGNHTFTHINTAGAGPEVAGQLDRTSAAIKKATNFTPCLFRPPFGSKSTQSVALARSKGMQTVEWDVDTSDYERPASFNIVQRVLGGVKPGSIVLMHDGGGPRDQSVAALPKIIKGLRAKGYRFVTLDELLSVRERYA
jgi:peptidoglycan/xylan/chitin deacetylase (PgdA/CDA1 family)